MSGRQYQLLNNSLAIRQEIHRFESVHPSIYAIYDLIELIPDTIISQQVREHVVCIEDSFVNSQEWTLSRSVPDLRLGIVGSLASGKSALVHRYLTGSYMQEESPEGGRFKKEVQLDGQSYLLLIRDEGGPPEVQFTAWVDAVLFVFSVESESSFNAIYSYYTKMAQHRNTADVPLLLVGTQDAISETSPRVIDDARARKLAADLKCCGYYETCATYGLAVQQVFLDACLRIIQNRMAGGQVGTPTMSRPTTPIHGNRYHPSSSNTSNLVQFSPSPSHKDNLSRQVHTLSASSHQLYRHGDVMKTVEPLTLAGSYATLGPGLAMTPVEMRDHDRLSAMSDPSHRETGSRLDPNRDRDLPTPTSTPTTTRKSRRRSNLFTSSKKTDEKTKNGEVGSGRAIPLKQGFLYKRSSKSLKEWKKKYVALCDDGMFTYYPNLQDYMDNVHGKQIPLQYVTVKVPGQKPRGSRATIPSNNGLTEGLSSLSISSFTGKDRRSHEGTKETVGEDGYLCFTNGAQLRPDPANVKKRHRRIKSSGLKTGETEESDGYEFLIVSLDSKLWQFEASSYEEREHWVTAIEQQILLSLQGSGSHVDAVRSVLGNSNCVDCGSSNPEWTSLNLGVLMCIECSGIHRNLGSHVSRVRSLHLDDWPPGHLSVMLNVGNSVANSVWESDVRGTKPDATSSRDEKERWIRRKYESKEFLAPPPSSPLGPQIVEAVCGSDIKGIYLLMAHASIEDVNCDVGPRDSRTPLHLACSLGSLPIAQLLIWNGADVQRVDHDGRSCLVYARAAAGAETTGLVELLIGLGCPDVGTLKVPHTVV